MHGATGRPPVQAGPHKPQIPPATTAGGGGTPLGGRRRAGAAPCAPRAWARTFLAGAFAFWASGRAFTSGDFNLNRRSV